MHRAESIRVSSLHDLLDWKLASLPASMWLHSPLDDERMIKQVFKDGVGEWCMFVSRHDRMHVSACGLA